MGYCDVCQSAGSVNQYGYCEICGRVHEQSRAVEEAPQLTGMMDPRSVCEVSRSG